MPFRATVLTCVLATALSCGPGDTLSVGPVLATLDADAASLHVRPDGSFLVGAPGQLVEVAARGDELGRYPTGDSGTPVFVGAGATGLYFRTHSSLLRIDPASSDSLVEQGGLTLDAVAVDPEDAPYYGRQMPALWWLTIRRLSSRSGGGGQ